MEIQRLIHAVFRKLWLILLLSFLGGGLAMLYNSIYNVPVYKSETTLYIMNRSKSVLMGQSQSMEDIMYSRQVIKDYGEIIKSRKVLTPVLRELKSDMLSEDLLKGIVKVELKKDTNVMAIQVMWPEPQMAAVIANTVGKVFASKIKELTNMDNVGVLDEAQVPDSPISTGSSRKVMIGFLAGMAAALGIIYILELFDTTIRSVEDVESVLKLRVVGIIPKHDIH